MRLGRGARRVLMVVLALLVSVSPIRAEPAAGATVLLPNLRMVHINQYDPLVIQVVNGRRLLRFTTIMVNLGQGPFEVRGHRASSSVPTMTATQVLYNDIGSSNAYPVGAKMQWSGDGHNHWHVLGAMSYELYNASGPITVRRGAKLGFCMLDSTPYSLGLPRAPQAPVYRGGGCGSQTATSLRTGVSVGWGDEYPWNFAYQWIDITGVAAGTYVLRATADQQSFYYETNNLDNCVWARITINASGSSVPVQARGSNCGPSSVTSVSTFPGAFTWSSPRRLAFEAGSYVGYRFNSIGTVLRTKTITLSAASGASTRARAIPIGQPTNWFYMVDGALAGYWVKDTSRIDMP